DLVHNVTIKPAIYASIASKVFKRIKIINAISGLGYNFINGREGIVQKILKFMMNLAFQNNVNFIFQNPDDMLLYQNLGYLRFNKSRLIKGAGVDDDKFIYTLPTFKDKLEVVLIAR